MPKISIRKHHDAELHGGSLSAHCLPDADFFLYGFLKPVGHAGTGSSPAAGRFGLPYQTELTDHDGRAFKLEEQRGRVVLVSMMYNSCTFVSPMLVDTMGLTRDTLTEKERTQLDALLITFEPARDDMKSLKSVLEKRALDPAHWRLARTDSASTRKIAAVLGIQYRLLPDGEYNHTTVLILLDTEGRILGRTRKIGAVDPVFLRLVRQTLTN